MQECWCLQSLACVANGDMHVWKETRRHIAHTDLLGEIWEGRDHVAASHRISIVVDDHRACIVVVHQEVEQAARALHTHANSSLSSP